MDEKPELYAIKYTFASLLENNPRECVVYIGGMNLNEAKRNFEVELDRVNRKFGMCYKIDIKEVTVVMCCTHKISLESLEQKVFS